jgi:hypothetical protein
VFLGALFTFPLHDVHYINEQQCSDSDSFNALLVARASAPYRLLHSYLPKTFSESRNGWLYVVPIDSVQTIEDDRPQPLAAPKLVDTRERVSDDSGS